VFLFPVAFALEKPVLPTSVWLWFLLLILSLLCSGLAYLLWYKALESVSATKAGVFLFFLPVVSVLMAHFVLSEPLDIPFAAGALLDRVGVIVNVMSMDNLTPLF
jgi:drug/metabolite transporter (DMT)-like permease